MSALNALLSFGIFVGAVALAIREITWHRRETGRRR